MLTERKAASQDLGTQQRGVAVVALWADSPACSRANDGRFASGPLLPA
jgi:hypothetical protein